MRGPGDGFNQLCLCNETPKKSLDTEALLNTAMHPDSMAVWGGWRVQELYTWVPPRRHTMFLPLAGLDLYP